MCTEMMRLCLFQAMNKIYDDVIRHIIAELGIVSRFPISICFYLIPCHLKVVYVSISSEMEPWLSESPTLP